MGSDRFAACCIATCHGDGRSDHLLSQRTGGLKDWRGGNRLWCLKDWAGRGGGVPKDWAGEGGVPKDSGAEGLGGKGGGVPKDWAGEGGVPKDSGAEGLGGREGRGAEGLWCLKDLDACFLDPAPVGYPWIYWKSSCRMFPYDAIILPFPIPCHNHITVSCAFVCGCGTVWLVRLWVCGCGCVGVWVWVWVYMWYDCGVCGVNLFMCLPIQH